MKPINGFCPYCHKEVAFSWVDVDAGGGSILTYFYFFKNKTGFGAVGECPSCENCVLIQLQKDQYGEFYSDRIHPNPLPSPTDERIPEGIRRDLDEAKTCLSVGCCRACAVMSRRAIQTACIDNGISKKNLEDQIDELKSKGIITEQIQKWAHSVRWVGNDAAHSENPDVTKDDAEDVLNLAEQIMKILYVMPAIAEEKNKIHGKKR